jgi:penicillin-binding protein 2
MAGKTGTAEYGPKALGKKRGWMIAFAPFDQPRYAVAVVVDDATGGGLDVGPRMQYIMAGLFRVPLAPPPEVNGG